MINNAIDHSEGRVIEVMVYGKIGEINVSIEDDGVGIFNKIQRDFNLSTPHEAVLELAKGKLTSDPSRHTGEGIFFSSRACRRFYIWSDKLVFSSKDGDDWLFDDKDKKSRELV